MSAELLWSGIMYSIKTDPGRNLIRLKLSGFWDKETFASFKNDVREAALSLRCSPGHHYVIADTSDAAIQSQEISILLLEYMKGKSFKFAFVTGNAVIKMQARRLFKETGVIVVQSAAEAEAMLFPPDGGASPHHFGATSDGAAT